MEHNQKMLLLFILSWLSIIQAWSTSEHDTNMYRSCPRLVHKIFTKYAPRGNFSVNIYAKQLEAHTIKACTLLCCITDGCNVAFMHKQSCYLVTCLKDEYCYPNYLYDVPDETAMVLVNPVTTDTWSDALDSFANYESTYNDHLVADETEIQEEKFKICTDDSDCGVNKECKQFAGFDGSSCVCRQGYMYNSTSDACTALASSTQEISALPQVNNLKPGHLSSVGNLGYLEGQSESKEIKNKPIKHITVSATSKQIELPQNSATLSAFTVPIEEEGGHPYKYKWTKVSGGSSGIMTDQNESTLKLSNLVAGLYTFKVAVSGDGAYGETFANLTVLPPKRLNQPPVAMIVPSHSTIKLPNTVAVLDGSSSKDDAKIKNYHWELQQGPLQYEPHLSDSPTLQINDLRFPGNYTFKLTVEDSDGATNSTTANITVEKIPDWPPQANPGQNVILYLPHNNITLNGSLSTDDHGIISWEWTKSPSAVKAVDMQNTRTPYLKLSNLEEGIYTFVLKVMDASNQTSEGEVHVFVKTPTNKPPVARAGSNLTISLPQTWTTLDGSKSTDDVGIVSWKWESISGPSTVNFQQNNASLVNVTGLTKGDYHLRLTVFDNNGNAASDDVFITVTQNKNAPPKANGGGDQTVILPINFVVLNGSASSDDLGIVKWEWFREPSSLALGTIILNSDKSPIVMLTGLVVGRYVFRLKVTDDHGVSSEDTVSIIVKPDPFLLSLVELRINVAATMLTSSQADCVVSRLGILLGKDIVTRGWQAESPSYHVLLTFYASNQSATEVVSILRHKLYQDPGLLQLPVVSVNTAVCQNNCSGHGLCEQETRLCLCEAFWMNDLFRRYLGDGESNCDWSILYVVVALFVLIVILVAVVWGIVCLCQRSCTKQYKKRRSYSLIQNNNHSEERLVLPVTESDSDSDVLFEARKSNGLSKPGRKSFKMDRRINT
ncbi:dyslexia-associated protein KIAA0319-like protein isoform X2 [Bemisia tabaci]|uniref:dyslexia-associated protein KIAA0319-like protein isoform X2 n=1 Tax=Bemisia tabaci TaxID=7038 RepID=UPI003B280DBF